MILFAQHYVIVVLLLLLRRRYSQSGRRDGQKRAPSRFITRSPEETRSRGSAPLLYQTPPPFIIIIVRTLAAGTTSYLPFCRVIKKKKNGNGRKCTSVRHTYYRLIIGYVGLGPDLTPVKSNVDRRISMNIHFLQNKFFANNRVGFKFCIHV